MQPLEKLSPKRIIKDVAPDSCDRSGDRMFFPGDMLDALNIRYYGHGDDGVGKSIIGNVIRPLTLPAGDNRVIGQFSNDKQSTIIYMMWNSAGSHQIIEYNPFTQIFTALIAGSILAFDKDYYIDQGGCIDDILLWNDRKNPIGKLLLTLAREGFYDGVTDRRIIMLNAIPPRGCPIVGRDTDNTKTINHITSDHWQFSYNFIYKDNGESVWSPMSKLIEGKMNGDPTRVHDNEIVVFFDIDPVLLPMIKIVQLGVRRGNDGSLYIWDKILNPDTTGYTRSFFGTEILIPVSLSQSVRIQDEIPLLTDALGIMRNRIFTSLNSVGFDMPQTFSFTATIEAATAPYDEVDDQYDSSRRYFKDGGAYVVGLLVIDEAGRPSFVEQPQNVSLPIERSVVSASPIPASAGDDLFGNGVSPVRKRIRWHLSGTFDPKFKRYAPVLSRNSAQAVYQQFECRILRYIRDLKEGEEDNKVNFNDDPTDNENFYSWRGKVFMKGSKSWSDNGGFVNTVMVQIPLNACFTPESGDVMRFLDYADSGRIYEFPILRMVGDLADIGQAPRYELQHDFTKGVFIEIYKPGQSQNLFFEIGEFHPIIDGVPQIASDVIDGDTYYHAQISGGNDNIGADVRKRFVFVRDSPNVEGGAGGVHNLFGWLSNTGVATLMETPANLVSFSGSVKLSNVGGIQGVRTIDRALFSIDYTKIGSDYGRVHTLNPLEKNYQYPNAFGFSEPYIQDSNINGLTSFIANNKYSIPLDRTKATAFKAVGNVLIALHQRNTSTLYVGEGLIRQGEDFIIAKTDGVVGDDRKLLGGFGSIHPESALVAYDQLFFWDAYNGAVVRYTNSGLFPISNNGMRAYFQQKAIDLFSHLGKFKVVSAFDYKYGEFILTFTDVLDEEGGIVIPGETWAFNLKNEVWTSRYSFVPENYASVQTHLLSFRGGTMWDHNKSHLHNNFYQVQYGRYWTPVCNIKPGKNKKLLNIHIHGNVATDIESDVPVFEITTPEGQSSWTPASRYDREERSRGKFLFPVLRDINSPVGGGKLALLSGDEMVSNWFAIKIMNDRTDESRSSHVNVFYKEEEFSI